MDKVGSHIQSKFISDKYDMQDISYLSLFLYEKLLAVIAHTEESQKITASFIYSFQEQETVNQIIETEEIFNAPNSEGKLYLHHQRFTLVPTQLFNASQCSKYLSFATEVNEAEDNITYTGIANNGIQVLGTADKQLLDQLDKKLPELEIAHGASHVLDYFLSQNQDFLNQELFIHSSPDCMYLAAFTEGKLSLFNRFIIADEASFLRYVFTFIQQMAFDRTHCKIRFFGNPEWLHTSKEGMDLYFKNIHIITPEQNVSYLSGAESFLNTHLLEAFWQQKIIS
ncbi:DUF3822 family protein [Cyclobacterium sp. 1_MG-2023]|uniref:DUF3822 family protein n=1 Tax=Cyclobacterium sp. 1_MG-2023 TaxID=3062681 RepID=UPI0026E47486|nr:DUF3822 family protein [Cyclobacterium sp. 1_MG-2023]MDO6437558.1 DUF3822 family protein [Cyclobacterium sp. 1_MG-2023]